MKTNPSLRTRLILSFTLLSTVVALTLALITYVVLELSEEHLIAKTIAQEAEMMARHFAEFPEDIVRTRKHFLLYVQGPGQTDTLPEEIESLSHRSGEVVISGIEYELIYVRKEPYDFYFLFDFSKYEIFERSTNLFLLGGVVVAIVTGIWLGLLTSRKVFNPLTRLAQSLEQEPDGNGVIDVPRDFADDEVGMLARKFIDYNARIRSYIKREKAFTANASHELRTPVAVIAGAAEVLEGSPTLSSDDRRTVSRIRLEADNMRNQLELLLAMARGQERFEDEDDIDVSAIITEQINDLEPVAEGISIEVIQNEKTSAYGSKTAMQIVVRNILNNAMSYTGEGRITVTTGKNSISVEDSGPGITHDIRDRVFERFFRGDRRDDTDHMGIGLSLAQHLCKISDWKISIESASDGRGTKVTLIT